MIITVPTSKETYIKAILRTVNAFLNLSPKELDVITAMVENGIITLDTEGREKLRKILNMDQANLNTHIHNLKKGRNVISKNNILSINPYIIKVIKDKSITFNFETH